MCAVPALASAAVSLNLCSELTLGKMSRGAQGRLAGLFRFGQSIFLICKCFLLRSCVAPRAQEKADGLLLRRLTILLYVLLLYSPERQKMLCSSKKLPSELFISERTWVVAFLVAPVMWRARGTPVCSHGGGSCKAACWHSVSKLFSQIFGG